MSPSLALPAHLTVRAPTRDDLPAIFTLIQASDLDVFGRRDYTFQDLQRDWNHPTFDPACDAWIVVGPDGELVGYATSASRNHFRIYCTCIVHPGYYDQGIGSALLRLLEERAREHISLAPPEVRVFIHIGVGGGHEPSMRLLTDHGYTWVRRFTHMYLSMDAPPPVPTWPEGITVRTMIPGQDERAIWEAMEEAFSDHWGHLPEPFEHWLQRHSGPGRLPPDLQYLAMAGDTVAGAALCLYGQNIGWVDHLGVRRPWRKLGLGLALLYHAFGEFYRRGMHNIRLGVDAQSLTGATRLYERAGMHPLLHYDVYEKELRPGVELAVQSLDDA
ncbi:MAG TPA: GNAT family N-acetyltransferase [Ktedonobacterales bacterium]|nr:GNAT family N-acetyltransferase [Ktedonobacterales bacterium]